MKLVSESPPTRIAAYQTPFLSPTPEFDLDPDDLDDAALTQLEAEQATTSRSGRHRDQSMPLLVGLLDTASARRSEDGTLLLHRRGEPDDDGDQLDLEAIAAKASSGGGLLDSVANMANSILGAGNSTVFLRSFR